MDRPYVIGCFQWAAVEHRGEATWPAICSKSGALDLFLQKKGAFYQNRSLWTEEPMAHIVPHWNFKGMEGQEVIVTVYTNCDQLELFLNGESLGRKAIEKYGHGEWNVVYAPGTLEVKGYRNGVEVASHKRITTGKPETLRLTLDNNCTYCILFNKTVVDQYHLEDPYQLVKDNKWTYDKFIEMGSVLPADLNGDGIRNRNDAYGVTVWLDSIVGMLHASGGAIAQINDQGKFELVLNNERNVDVLTSWTRAGASELSNFITSDTDETAHRSFTTNNCLFYTRYIGIGAYFRDSDLDFGFLPYPKWDESQEDYCNTMHAYGTSWLCIPSSVKDVEQSGAILESLSYYGQKLVNPAYYEITLEGKTIRDEESADMLDIIFATRFFDVGFYYQVGDYGNTIFDMFYSGNTNFSSLFKASEKIVAKKLQTIDESFDKIG
jgi:hypothetical protein